MRDMVRNLGGLLSECYIRCRKPPKLQAISLRRYRSSVLLVRFAQPAKLRLRKTQAFFSAQNDRLIVCLVVCVCFRRHPSKLRFASWQICSAKIATALRCVIKFGCTFLHTICVRLRATNGLSSRLSVQKIVRNI